MKKVFKIFIYVLVINSCFSIKSSFSSFLEENDNVKEVIKPFRKGQNYVEDRIYSDFYANYEEDYGVIKINSIKTLDDLNGNSYNLVEFSPSGYAIYNQDFSMMLEMSSKANSPYFNKEGDLIYLGAFNYYTIKNSVTYGYGNQSLVHCLEDYEVKLDEENSQRISEYANTLKKVHIVASIQKLHQ